MNCYGTNFGPLRLKGQQLQIGQHVKLIQLRKFRSKGLTLALGAVLVMCGGCYRGWQEFSAWDSIEDIFFDARENDPKFGFRLLHSRWQSFKPLLFPNSSNMREARILSGACLVVAYWDQLSESDRRTIIDEACVPDSSLSIEYNDFTIERKKITLVKAQIMEKGKASLSPDQRKLWDDLSKNFGSKGD